MNAKIELATIGGGCFWCTEAVFQELIGVEKVVSGYAGGQVPDPTYAEICRGNTGHAEVIQITYDPDEISFSELLDVFWRTHDPTTLNRQGADVGSQYRSIILYHDGTQCQIAEQSKAAAQAAGLWSNPFVTEIAPLARFYPAEAYHQGYYRNNSAQPYCQIVIDPKIRKFRKAYAKRLKN